jgi:hypothetical protein
LISKPSSFAFDVAVSSVEHDARLLRELERQLTLRLPSAPPLRPVWTTAATELLDAPRPGVFGKTARVVVVLHQHLWGKDATTKDDAEAIKRRITAKGPESVRVVLLDRTTPPTWLRKSPSRALGAPDQCADWIVSAVADLGGATRQTASDAVVEIPVADQRSLQQRDSFLGSHRAITQIQSWTCSLMFGVPPLYLGSRASNPALGLPEAWCSCSGWCRSGQDAVVDETAPGVGERVLGRAGCPVEGGAGGIVGQFAAYAEVPGHGTHLRHERCEDAYQCGRHGFGGNLCRVRAEPATENRGDIAESQHFVAGGNIAVTGRFG